LLQLRPSQAQHAAQLLDGRFPFQQAADLLEREAEVTQRKQAVQPPSCCTA
jgi:hypothetical protein